MVNPTDEESIDTALGSVDEEQSQGSTEPTNEDENPAAEGDESTEGDGDGDESNDEDETSKDDKPTDSEKPSRVDRKINRMYRQKMEALEAAQYYASENAKLRELLDKNPRLPKEAFGDEEAFIQDRINRGRAEDIAKELERNEAAAHKQYLTALYAEWDLKEQELGLAGNEDYQRTVGSIANSLGSNLKLALYESPVGPALALELAKDPDELAYLNRLGRDQLRAELIRKEFAIRSAKASAPATQKKQSPATPKAASPKPSGESVKPKKVDIYNLKGDAFLKAHREMMAAKKAAAQKRR